MTLLTIRRGEQIQEELEALSMSDAGLARQIDVPTNHISQILKGERDITADIAMRLGPFLHVSVEVRIKSNRAQVLAKSRSRQHYLGIELGPCN